MIIPKNIICIHSTLVAIAPAAFLWSANFGEVFLREALQAIIILMVFGLVVQLIFYYFSGKDLLKSSIVSSAFLFAVLFFGYINYTLFTSVIQLRWRWSFLILICLFLSISFFILRTKRDLTNTNKLLSIVAGTFVLLSVLQIANQTVQSYVGEKDTENEIEENQQTQDLPDIYYIILDGYSSPEVLREVFDYEKIEDFVTFLESEDFYVATNSRTNYGSTDLSLPSSLNMEYLAAPTPTKPHFLMFENNKLLSFFKSYGYKYIQSGDDAFTFYNRYADENINLGSFTPYHMTIWENTMFSPIESALGGHGIFAEKLGFLNRRKLAWDRAYYKLNRLGEISEEYNDPIFVLAHFLIPQGAYVFDENGKFISENELVDKTRAEIYIDQVGFINNEMKKLINTLKDKSEQEPIIIIQGDHGFMFRDSIELNTPEKLQRKLPESISMEEILVPTMMYSYPILNTYYFPEQKTELLYDSISPVNSFRVVLNTYFNQNLEILDDVSYAPDFEGTKFVPIDTLDFNEQNKLSE